MWRIITYLLKIFDRMCHCTMMPNRPILLTRNLPVLGRWFKFEPLVWLSLSHFVVEDYPNYIWAGRAEPISFRCRRPPRPLLGRSGCVYLTPASKGHPKHIKAGEAPFTTFRRRRPPITLLGRSGCVYLTPASKGHPKHIKAGEALFTTFQC
jgi:hypothetical protein